MMGGRDESSDRRMDDVGTSQASVVGSMGPPWSILGSDGRLKNTYQYCSC